MELKFAGYFALFWGASASLGFSQVPPTWWSGPILETAFEQDPVVKKALAEYARAEIELSQMLGLDTPVVRLRTNSGYTDELRGPTANSGSVSAETSAAVTQSFPLGGEISFTTGASVNQSSNFRTISAQLNLAIAGIHPLMDYSRGTRTLESRKGLIRYRNQLNLELSLSNRARQILTSIGGFLVLRTRVSEDGELERLLEEQSTSDDALWKQGRITTLQLVENRTRRDLLLRGTFDTQSSLLRVGTDLQQYGVSAVAESMTPQVYMAQLAEMGHLLTELGARRELADVNFRISDAQLEIDSTKLAPEFDWSFKILPPELFSETGVGGLGESIKNNLQSTRWALSLGVSYSDLFKNSQLAQERIRAGERGVLVALRDVSLGEVSTLFQLERQQFASQKRQIADLEKRVSYISSQWEISMGLYKAGRITQTELGIQRHEVAKVNLDLLDARFALALFKLFDSTEE